MKTIYKFQLKPAITEHSLHSGAEILTVQVQRGEPYIWVLMNPAMEKVKVKFRVYPTGASMEENPGKYIGTFQLEDLGLVFHVYETSRQEIN